MVTLAPYPPSVLAAGDAEVRPLVPHDMLHEHARALDTLSTPTPATSRAPRTIHPEYAAPSWTTSPRTSRLHRRHRHVQRVGAARTSRDGRRRVIGSFLHGTMANALPHAIGAQRWAYPGRQVISIPATAGLGMLLGELLTVRSTGLR